MKNLYLIIFALLICTYSNGQTKENIGIMPDSYYLNLEEETDHVKILPPSAELIKAEDNDSEKDGTMYYIGRLLPVNLTTDNSGTWNTLDDGTQIWKLRLSSQDAKASALHFDYFKLKEKAKLFVYNNDYSVILGPFTSEDNPQGWEYSIGILYGNDITIEYILPPNYVNIENKYKNDDSDSDFKIESYSYIYRGEYLFFDNQERSTGYGTSDNCQVNANCFEGDNWRIQQKGVARIYVRDGWQTGYCTGSLINNVENDETPYFLTAAHCGETATSSNFNQWQFDFNYESSGCSATSEPSKNSFTGCNKKAMGALNGGSDFLLLELSATSTQLKNANIVYNGWRNTDEGSANGVSIHHPSGDIKKISTYTTPLEDATYSGSYGNNGAANAHWEVIWSATTNGHGVTEGGSSGSPIFDNNGYIIGTLSGGSSYCNYKNYPDLYGKLSYHWDSNGTSSSSQLKPWLDPNNTGATTCELLDPNGTVDITADFSADNVKICENTTINFKDVSGGEPTIWNWDFGDGSSSTEQDPSHTYTQAGQYTVTLYINKNGYSRTETKTDYVIVNENPEITHSTIEANGQQVADGSIELEVSKGIQPYIYIWSHNNDLNSPIVENLLSGIYNVTVFDANNCNSSQEINVGYIENNSNIDAENYSYSIYPNPIKDLLTIKFENDVPENIEVINMLGKTICQTNNISTINSLDLSSYNSGIYFIKLNYKGKSIIQKIILN